jgi:hypothetical protein
VSWRTPAPVLDPGPCLRGPCLRERSLPAACGASWLGRVPPGRPAPFLRRDMDEQVLLAGDHGRLRGGLRKPVADLLQVLGELPVGVVDLAELPDHPGEVGLPVGDLPRDDPRGLGQRRHPEVLAGQHRLRLDQLLVEAVQRQPRGQHRVLHVEQPVVQGGQPPGLRQPGLGARVGSLHGDVDDLRHRQRPLPDELEPRLVPVRVGDDVDGHAHPHGPGQLKRLVVYLGRGLLAERPQSFLIERLQAKEHVVQAEPPPAPEYLLVLDQHVGAGLEVVLLLDLTAASTDSRR